MAALVDPPWFHQTKKVDTARIQRSSRATFQITPAPTAAPNVTFLQNVVGTVGAVVQAVPTVTVLAASAASCAWGVKLVNGVEGVFAGTPKPMLVDVAPVVNHPCSRKYMRRVALVWAVA